ncbi:MAG: PAS domain S-box protein [Rhodobacter sp.]|nr:PAS domain S-box protein [Paracoccaceae bacterium]MCC0075282.1 PAS domain S-box protein [Rhodobacter sp.]
MEDGIRHAEHPPRIQSETYALVAEALGVLLRAGPRDLGHAIESVLGRLAHAVGADRAFVVVRRHGVWGTPHHWCAPGTPAVDGAQREALVAALVQGLSNLAAGEALIVDDTAALPALPLGTAMHGLSIRAALAVPVMRDGHLAGFVKLDRVQATQPFSDYDLWLTRALADGLMSSLARYHAEEERDAARRAERETLARLRATLAAMPELLLEIDEDGRCIDFHCTRPELLAAPPEEILGLTLEDTLPPGIARLQREGMARARRDGTATLPPYPLGSGAARRWYALTIARRDGSGSGYVFRIRDVTDERARDDESAMLGEITRLTTNLVIVLAADQSIRWVNPAFEARTGWTLGEVRGRHPADFADPASDPAVLARIARAIETRSSCRAEVFKHDRHGQPYWVDVEVKPFLRPEGTLDGFLIIETDITQRKHHEAELAHLAHEADAARDRLRDAVEALPDGFAYFDADDRLVMCNSNYRALFRSHPDRVKPGIPFADLLRLAVGDGEFATMPGGAEAFVAARLDSRRQPVSSLEVQLASGRWLRVIEQSTPDGGRVGLRIDITALKDAKKRLNDIIDGARIGTWEYDFALGMSDINRGWTRILGWDDRVVTRLDRDTWRRVIHPSDNELLRAAIGAIRAGTSDTIEQEIRLRHRGGHWVHMLVRGRISSRDSAGLPLRISGVGLDLTERRLAEERLHAILEASEVGTWQLDAISGTTRIDAQYAAMLGYRLPELLPFTHARFESLVHPDDLPQMHTGVARLRGTGQNNVAHEFRMRHRDGHWIWILSHARVQRWAEDGTAAEESGLHINITDRKTREAALSDAKAALERALTAQKASEQRFTDIAAVSSDWFWELDSSMRLAFLSPGFERTTGIPGEAVIGLSVAGPFDAAARTLGCAVDGDWNTVRLAIEGRQSFADFVYRMDFSDGRPPIWQRISGAPYYDAEGRIAGYRGVGSEVSALVAATERAQAANRAKSRFLANMSHELRTPLTGVLGMTDLLSETPVDAQQREMIDTIRESGEGLLTILNDILDLAKIEAGKLAITREAFVPAQLLRRVRALFAPRATASGLDLQLVLGAGCEAPRSGDANRILQVLNNLVGNALKFTESGSVVITAAIAPDPGGTDSLRIEVADTGIGMTADQAAKVFDEFEQAETSTARRFGGTGLGLSITRRLVALMGGEIALDTAPGAGTRVTVSLPVTPAGTRRTEAAPPPRVEVAPGLRVLVADDNRTNRKILETMLRSLGLQVALAEDGRDACRLYRPGDFDLVLLDISMPVLDGLGALAAIRDIDTRAGRPPVPALAVTANAMDHQVAEYIAAGFAGHIAKPFRKETLAAAIAALHPA